MHSYCGLGYSKVVKLLEIACGEWTFSLLFVVQSVPVGSTCSLALEDEGSWLFLSVLGREVEDEFEKCE